ncbi:unnamed protein product [Rotaria socialis]|uniref:Uncharacterized protein n=1 Tax=Rotaria socialis TaxID=392032 RepID=A0A820QT99_9BILA|nr:unnamed protein product [Rotaria socialis]
MLRPRSSQIKNEQYVDTDVFIRDGHANNRFRNSSIEDDEVQRLYHRIRRNAAPVSDKQLSYKNVLSRNSPKFSRPGGGGMAYYFMAVQITASTSASYTFVCDSRMDTYGYLYTLPFIPSSSQSNLVVAEDDGGSQGNFQITATFTVNQSMILVVTTYHTDDIGEFNISIHGPAQLSLTPYISTLNIVTNTNEATSVETTATTTTTPIITTATTVTTKLATKKSTKRAIRRTTKKVIRPTITTPIAVTATTSGIQSSYSGALTEKSSSFIRPKQGESGFNFLAIKLKTSSSGIYTIVCESGIDTYGCLHNESFLSNNPNSKLIATDDDSGSKRNCKLIANLTTAESMILVVTTYNAEQTGAFKVIVYGPEKAILSPYVTTPLTTTSTSTTTSTTKSSIEGR